MKPLVIIAFILFVEAGVTAQTAKAGRINAIARYEGTSKSLIIKASFAKARPKARAASKESKVARLNVNPFCQETKATLERINPVPKSFFEEKDSPRNKVAAKIVQRALVAKIIVKSKTGGK